MSDSEEARTPAPLVVDESVVEIIPTAQFEFQHRLIPNTLVYAILEPNGQEVLAAVTTSNRVIVKDSDISLTLNETIKCMTTVKFNKNYEYIVLGTESNIVVFDVYDNTTVFKRDVPDGVNCLVVGKLGKEPLMIFCGGNSAIWGFDAEGNNNYWTVTGDAISTMCICDYDNDGELELIVGSPDSEIRIFKNDLMRHELNETDAVIYLTTVGQDLFAYGLNNGTIGVYQRDNRIWRIKSKSKIVSVIYVEEEEIMICAWNQGKIDIRSVSTGEITHRDHTTNAQVVSTCQSNVGKFNMTVAFSDGKIRQYEIAKRANAGEKTQEIIREYGQKKHNLMMELSNLEVEENTQDRHDIVPINTKIATGLQVCDETLTVFLHASHEVCIRAVVIFAEGLFFDGEAFIWVPSRIEGAGDKAYVQIIPEKDVSNALHVKCLVGNIASTKLLVLDLSLVIPTFGRFALDTLAGDRSTCYVEFEYRKPLKRFVEWIRKEFVVGQNVELSHEQDDIELGFVGLAPHKGKALWMVYKKSENKMTIYHEDMETVANIIQNMCKNIELPSLNTVASFPDVFAEAEEILGTMDTMADVRNQLMTEQQERQSAVKETIVRAEDAVALRDFLLARRLYTRLKKMDSAARQAALLRANNQERCAQTLRRLNKIIDTASKLRYGENSRDVVNLCRSAIADDNKHVVLKVLQFGAAERV